MKKALAVLIAISTAIPMQAYAASNINVFAASSLTQSFTQIGKDFEKRNPAVKINFSFQASSTLLTQIKSGAPADIFVSAEAFPGGSNYVFNRVVLATNKKSKIRKISDLNGKVTWIQCAHEVPCGSTADAALIGEGVTSKPISLEPKVTSAVAKLVSGEVDAAIIYKTDVFANKNLRGIDFANKDAAKTNYQIAQLKKSRWSTNFYKFLQSDQVKKYLERKGFELK